MLSNLITSASESSFWCRLGEDSSYNSGERTHYELLSITDQEAVTTDETCGAKGRPNKCSKVRGLQTLKLTL